MFANKVRSILKRYFDQIKNEKLKHNLLQAIPFWIASLLTGLVAVFYSRLFTLTENLSSRIFHFRAWIFLIATPACFIAAWWAVKKFSQNARGSGIPQVMAAIEFANPKQNYLIDKLLSIRIIIVKIISSLVMALGGGVIGREGPTIQIAGSIFRKINTLLPAWWPKISKRNMIMTGAAAGLAAAFNTPLGGIVFAVEELTKTHISYFKTALFTAVIISGLTAQGLLGPYLYLGYPDIGHLSFYIFFDVIFIAAIGGISSAIMSKIILRIFQWKQNFRISLQHVFYLLICALIISSLAIFVDASILGSGKGLMQTVLFTSNKHLAWYAPILRFIGTIFSFTTGGAGGIFAPALSAGASVGSAFSGWFHLNDADTNLLILAGMVGFLTGITRTPFTSAIIVLEMTDRHNVIFHLMLAGMVASMVAYVIDRHSFYDHLKFRYMHELLHEEAVKSGEIKIEGPNDNSPNLPH